MKLAYRKIGSGNPLFILHGLFGSSDNWQTLGRQFAESFTVYLIDLRNHGRSPHSSNFSYSVMAGDINEVMADEGIEKAFMLGHSMGGKAAMYFSVENPGKVEKLIVGDIGTKQYPVTHQLIIDALEQINLQTLSSRKEAEEILTLHIADAGTRQFLLKNLYWNDNEKLSWRFNLEAIKNNIINVGEATPMPTAPLILPVLFIKGEQSDYILPEDMAQIQRIFPQACLEVIPSAGHWLHADQPQQFFKTVMQFLRSGV